MTKDQYRRKLLDPRWQIGSLAEMLLEFSFERSDAKQVSKR